MQILKDIDAVREVLSSLENVALVCAEQSLTKLICLVAMRNFGQTSLKLNEPSVAVAHADSDSLLTQLQYLEKAIDSEELASPEIERIFSSCQDKIKQQRWEDLQKILEELRRGLVAFDIAEMLYLVDKTDSATDLIKGRDIVLLLGGTGAGKSTTIQYLAGSKMEKKQIVVETVRNSDGTTKEHTIPHIEATEIFNEALKEVKSSYAAQSETRYIAAVPVKPTDVKPRLKEEAILCDTPGFADSRGPEIDVANGVGFVRAVRACKSVRPFILFDGSGLPNLRYKALKTVMITLSGLIPDVNKYLDTFLYGFTKLSEEEAQKLIGQLINFRDTGLKQENEHKEMLEAIVYDMINKFDDDDNVFVDPLDEKPGNVFKKIMAQPPIKNPQSVFRFSASDVSYSAIQDQIRRHQVSIMSALGRSDYALVTYKLSEVRKLRQVLEFPFITEAYRTCLKKIFETLESKFSAHLSHLERMMSDGNDLTSEDIHVVTAYLKETSFAKEHLQQELPMMSESDYTTQFSQHLVMKSEGLVKRIEEEELLHSERNQLRLDKLKKLSESFSGMGVLTKYYQEICQSLEKRYVRLSIGAQEAISSNNFDELCHYWTLLKLASTVLKQHVETAVLEERYKSVGVKLAEHFDLKLKNIEKLFEQSTEQSSLTDDDISKVETCLKLLQIAKNAEGLKAHFPIMEITEREQFLVEKIKTYVDCLHTKIAQSFNADTEKALVQVEPWFKLMKTLCEMPGLPREIEKSYEKTKLLVLDRARALGGRFAGELKSIQEGTKVDYRYLAKGLQGLKQAAWVDQIAPGAYQSVLVEIEEAITVQIEQMEAEVTALDLPLDNEDGFKKAQLFCETLENMKPLDKTIESIGSFRARILLKIEEAIGATLKSVDKVFSLDGLGLSDLENEIRRLTSDRNEYDKYLPAPLYLAENNYESVDALEAEIDKKEIYLKSQERELSSKINKCIEDEKVLHDIYMKHADLLKSSGASGVFSLRRASPADTFLKESGFLSHVDLMKKLEEKEDEKQKLQNEANTQIQTSEAEIMHLRTLLKRHDELRHSKQISDKAKIFLNQRGHSSLEELEKKLIQKEKSLAETLSQGIRYQFTKLDATAALKAVDYLVWAKSLLGISPTFRRAVIESSEKLTAYLKHYMEFLEGRVEHYLSNINGHLAGGHSESKKIFEDCQLLLNRLQEIKELRSNYKSLFAYFKNPTLLEYCSHELDQIALDREGLMQTYSGAHDVANINKNLLFMKALSQLDEFSTFTQAGSKFIEIYLDYRAKANVNAGEVVTQAMNAISEHRYDEFAALMAQLESAGTQPAILNQLKQTLSNSLLNDAEETKMKAILLGHDIKEEWMALVISLRANLEIIKKALTYVPQYLGVSQASLSPSTDKMLVDPYNETIQFVKEQLSERIIKAMDNISASIGGGSFAQAEEKMAIIKKAKHILGSYLSVEAIQKVDSFSTDLDKNLNAQVDFYEKLELSDYYRRPPKDQYKHFKQVIDINQQCRETWDKIEGVIRDKFRTELKNIKEANRSPDLRAASIRKFELALKSLPEYLQEVLTQELDDIKQDIKREESDQKSHIEFALQNEDVPKINELIATITDKEGSNSYSVRHLHQGVIEKAVNLKKEIDSCVVSNDISGALSFAQKLFIYKELEGKITNLKPLLLQVQNNIRQFLNKVFELLSKFSLDDNPDVIRKNAHVLLETNKFFEQLKKDEQKIFLRDIFDDINVVEKVDEFKAVVLSKLEQNQQFYQMSLESFDFIGIKQSLHRMKNIDPFYRSYKDEFLLPPMYSYAVSTEKLVLFINAVFDRLNTVRLINDETMGFEKTRGAFYDSLMKDFNVLKQVDNLRDHLGNRVPSVEILETKVNDLFVLKAREIYEDAFSILTKPRLTNLDANKFNGFFENLRSLKANFPVSSNLTIKVDEWVRLLDGKINESLDLLKKDLIGKTDIQYLLDGFIKLKSMGETFPHKSKDVNAYIDDSINEFRKAQGKNWQSGLSKLASLLNEELTGIGASVVNENAVLKMVAANPGSEIRRQTHNIDYVLDRLRSPNGNVDIDTGKLKNCYYEFERKYKELKTLYLKPDLQKSIQAVIAEIDYSVGQLKPRHSADKIVWNATMEDMIPTLMAHIFILWTLKNASHYFDLTGEGEGDKDSYLMIPHPAQVVSIFRMLGIGYVSNLGIRERLASGVKVIFGGGSGQSNDSLVNNMVQIGTGEGKSVTLAVSAAILALFGIGVNCACYSEYLSKRDYDDFKSIFEDLGLVEHIRYGTFNELCEDIVNKDGNVRDVVKTLISKDEMPKKLAGIVRRPQILLVDEVDVFFNKDFYGNLYSLSARLTHQTILELATYLWKDRGSLNSLEQVKAQPVYAACLAQYGQWGFLIDEAIKDMIAATKTYQSQGYVVRDDKVGYKEQDGISFTANYGYQTLFAYFHEHEKGNISQESLEKNIGILIKCGSFSYAELPHRFVNIMGVTGTLEHLSQAEKEVMRDSYGIQRETYMPSVYGDNKRKFARDGDVKIEDGADYFIQLCAEIQARIQGSTADTKRSVLVFFENKEKLMTFRDSDAIKSLQYPVEIITEEANDQEKKDRIKKASRSGSVTLLTRSFGRGTDFISYSPLVNANGGVHVIQTFLSEEKSEEIQIMGRTARQGQDGSFSLVLLDNDLEKFLIMQEDIDKIRADGIYHDRLDVKRNAYFAVQYAENSKFIAIALAEHKLSEKFIDALYNGDVDAVKRFLGERNQGANLRVKTSRTLCLMDATGSMSQSLEKAKLTVKTMFERANVILKDAGIPDGSYEIQFAVYRNYNSPENEILQSSSWESKPDNIFTFMKSISVAGGWGNEAVEIGLWHANQQTADKDKPLSRVILIGDAPANTESDVAHKRQKGAIDWDNKSMLFKKPTHYKAELQELTNKKVTVHAFFVDRRAEQNFREIGQLGGGRSEFLDINSSAGSELLTDVVTKEVLSGAAADPQQEKALLAEYDKRFGNKTYI